jgi:hypothetical protein
MDLDRIYRRVDWTNSVRRFTSEREHLPSASTLRTQVTIPCAIGFLSLSGKTTSHASFPFLTLSPARTLVYSRLPLRDGLPCGRRLGGYFYEIAAISCGNLLLPLCHGKNLGRVREDVRFAKIRIAALGRDLLKTSCAIAS